MRIALYYSNHDIRIEEVPRPKIGPGELLVRVEACGICGSDVMEWYRKDRVPLVLGHEVAGVVEEVNSIKDFKIGDRVVCAHHVACGNCHYCLTGHETVCDTLRNTNFDPGGFAQFIRLARINVEKGTFALPKEVSFDEAAFVEPLACILRGQRHAGGVKNKCVLVIGSGIGGILHIHLARFFGARFILATDVIEYRLELAQKFGADAGVNAKDYSADIIRRDNLGRLADLVIVTTGAPSAIQQAMESADRGATVLFFAPTEQKEKVCIPFNDLFWRNDTILTSSYAASPSDYKEALDLIAGKRLNVLDMITHRFGLEEIGKGFQLVAEAKGSLKVVIYPQR